MSPKERASETARSNELAYLFKHAMQLQWLYPLVSAQMPPWGSNYYIACKLIEFTLNSTNLTEKHFPTTVL